MTPDPLDIPEFLRRQPGDGQTQCAQPGTVKPKRQRRKKHPPGWVYLTKAEQDGTADAVTIALRRQREHEQKKTKQKRKSKRKRTNADDEGRAAGAKPRQQIQLRGPAPGL
jgi:hypothetical protein